MNIAADSPKRAVHGRRDEMSRLDESSSNRVAHTLTACTRCRTRKTRCDPGLPRCGPCERTNSHCEYFDPTKGVRIPRNYVVHLQHKVRELERQLAEVDKDDGEQDPEVAMRTAAAVRVQESDESKFLGPSSGIAITRLVMQLAKQYAEVKSISELVSEAKAKSIKEEFVKEDQKPTSKIYPLISNVAAEELPNRELTDLLVNLFYVKVHAMYPIFHEPTFLQDVEDVYQGTIDPYRNFAVRMVIAISMQRMDTKFAGLADSYYLAALRYLPATIKLMDLRTLQCFVLIGGYSLLTPTRTAVYYIIGMAVRLAQALGIHEEKTIARGRDGQLANALEIDMRRRVFWSVMVMEYGLAHSLGRPSILATSQEHIDVDWFAIVDDKYITADGILPGSPSLKKWVARHFYQMRLLQLEIRRKLYQKKRSEPKDDQDPWFQQMEKKLTAWRDASPDHDEDSGMTTGWFNVRCNTMIVLLFRPSPQVPRPSERAAIQCYDAVQTNIYIQKAQIDSRNVDITWIFTQSLFMSINTMLWTLSYSAIRQQHPKDEVEGTLQAALESITQASARWPGVVSALELYQILVQACLKIYDKADGDIPISAASPGPSEAGTVSTPIMTEASNRSQTTSPATVSTQSISTPPERTDKATPFGYINPNRYSVSPQVKPTSPSQPIASSSAEMQNPAFMAHATGDVLGPVPLNMDSGSRLPFDPVSHFNPLPATFDNLGAWTANFPLGPSPNQSPYGMPSLSSLEASMMSGNVGFQTSTAGLHSSNNFAASPAAVQYSDYLYPQSWAFDRPDMGLNMEQHMELMQSLETSGQGELLNMIEASEAIFGSG